MNNVMITVDLTLPSGEDKTIRGNGCWAGAALGEALQKATDRARAFGLARPEIKPRSFLLRCPCGSFQAEPKLVPGTRGPDDRYWAATCPRCQTKVRLCSQPEA